jgi:hypothetical protein
MGGWMGKVSYYLGAAGEVQLAHNVLWSGLSSILKVYYHPYYFVKF